MCVHTHMCVHVIFLVQESVDVWDTIGDNITKNLPKSL